MAKKTLINRKTGKELLTSDPEAVMKKHPKIFREKPDTKLAKDIIIKDEEIVKKSEPKEKKQPTSSDKKD